MKIIMDLTFVSNITGSVKGTVRKTLETSCIPVPGMHIEDSAWKDSREICGVCINHDEDYYYISIENEEIPTSGNYENMLDMYRSHGWQVLGAGR